VQKIKDEEGEGCNIHGFLDVNKVAGSIHFAPGHSLHPFNIPVYDIFSFQREYNVSRFFEPYLIWKMSW